MHRILITVSLLKFHYPALPIHPTPELLSLFRKESNKQTHKIETKSKTNIQETHTYTHKHTSTHPHTQKAF